MTRIRQLLGDSSIYKYWGKRPGKSDLNPELLFQKTQKPTKSFHLGQVYPVPRRFVLKPSMRFQCDLKLSFAAISHRRGSVPSTSMKMHNSNAAIRRDGILFVM